MMTLEEELELGALIENISDTEKSAFRELINFVIEHPAEGVLDAAREAGCKSFEEALLYLHENYKPAASHA